MFTGFVGQRILKDLPRKFQMDEKGHFLAYGHGLDSLGNRFLFAIIKWGQHFAFLSKNSKNRHEVVHDFFSVHPKHC